MSLLQGEASGRPGFPHGPLARAAPEERTVKDLGQALKGLEAEAAQRQAKFEESMKAQKTKKDLLDRKFQDALKRAKDEPITKPTRDIDLD